MEPHKAVPAGPAPYGKGPLLVQEPCTVVSIDLYGELPKGKDGMVLGIRTTKFPTGELK